MPKEYFCKQLKELEICGENNPDKFEPGRYSTCRECRKNFVKDYNKGIREEERKKKEGEIIDKISGIF